MPCGRCRKCGARKQLGMPPEQYIRPPKCPRPSCGARSWREDKYRQRVERGRASNPCTCGEYHYPHRRGSGWCEHNAKISDDDRQERWESGRSFRLR